MTRALALVALLACVPLRPAWPTRAAVVRVAFGAAADDPWTGPWRADQLAQMRPHLARLDGFGVRFVAVDNERDADVVVRPYTSRACAQQAGRCTTPGRSVELDPSCLGGYDSLRAGMAHELLHWLGAEHVCRYLGEERGCSPVGYGPALMNPAQRYPVAGEHPEDGAWVQDVPNELDAAEMRRVRGVR